MLASFKSFGQTAEKVSTKFTRPSITNLFVEPTNSREATVVNSFQKINMVSKFNEHSINYPNFKPQLPLAPTQPEYTDLPAMKLYNSQIAKRDSLIREQIKPYVSGASNLMLAKWWGRDKNGDFNTDLIGERGTFSATDADVLSNKAAAVNRIQDMGEQLIDKTYAIVYTISDVKTMEEVYNATDAAGAKVKDYKPVERKLEGYQLGFTASLYKLNFGKEACENFYNVYWSDVKNHNDKNVQAWGSATFPLTFVLDVEGTTSSTQPIDRNAIEYKLSPPKTMEELLAITPSDIQESAIKKMSKKVEDFRVKAPIFEEKPLSAKLGSKEGLYIDERFFAYEIEQDENGNQVKKRKGVARVKRVINNDTIATGETKPSIFQQQGGKKLYQGMLLEAQEDIGISIYAGYRLNMSDNTMGGFGGGADLNISQILSSVTKGKIPTPPGIYLGASIAYNPMIKKKLGSISNFTDPTSYPFTGPPISDSSTTWSGSSMALDISLSKEVYFTRKGNIYLLPSIGGAMSTITIEKYDDIEIKEAFGDYYDEKDWAWSAMAGQASLGFGINLNPNVSLLIKPMFVMKLAYTTGNDALIQQNSVDSKDYSPNWGFENIGETKVSFPIFMCVKIRL